MGAMTAGRRAATACRALLRALQSRALNLRNHRCFRGSGGEASSSTASLINVLAAAFLSAAAAALLFPRAVAFFLPLVASTSAFCATAYLSAAPTDPERGAAKEVVLVAGEGAPAEAGLLEVYADANATSYRVRHGDAVQVGCFLRTATKRGVDEDGEEVVFAGRLLAPAPDAAAAGALEAELAALQVDRLAEGVWNSYFGRWSTWNHYAVDGCDDDW